jgi:hypothetical protein
MFGNGSASCTGGLGLSEGRLVDEYQDAARRIVEVLGEPAAREFLTLLESNDTVRADAFQQLYERGDNDALLDSLHNLEADPVVRGWLVEHLNTELGGDA